MFPGRVGTGTVAPNEHGQQFLTTEGREILRRTLLKLGKTEEEASAAARAELGAGTVIMNVKTLKQF